MQKERTPLEALYFEYEDQVKQMLTINPDINYHVAKREACLVWDGEKWAEDLGSDCCG